MEQLTEVGVAGALVIIILREVFTFLKDKKNKVGGEDSSKIDKSCEGIADNKALLKEILTQCESTRRIVADMSERRSTGDHELTNLIAQNSFKTQVTMATLAEVLEALKQKL